MVRRVSLSKTRGGKARAPSGEAGLVRARQPPEWQRPRRTTPAPKLDGLAVTQRSSAGISALEPWRPQLHQGRFQPFGIKRQSPTWGSHQGWLDSKGMFLWRARTQYR